MCVQATRGKGGVSAVGKLEKAYFKMVRPFAFNGLEPGRGCTHVRTNRTGRVSRGEGEWESRRPWGPRAFRPLESKKRACVTGRPHVAPNAGARTAINLAHRNRSR